jgi:methylmalonyl-CoA/ethylmalonyl-CoA epimerase
VIPNIDLDHVAVALEHHTDAWPRYARDLPPARWIGGGGTSGFWSAQVEYANGMKVEVLEPYQVEQNDFLRRFLDRNGPGPHHLTFKVKDLAHALELAEAAGYRPVGVNLENSWWKEAFLHPKDAPGVVVQLAESNEGGDWGGGPSPDWLPAPRHEAPATLVHVAHALGDLEEGRRLFVDLLGGKEIDEDEADGIRWVDVAWPGPGRVRLLRGAPLDPWLEGRAGRVHHLAFTTVDPHTIGDAAPAGAGAGSDATFEVEPDANHGVRLRLSATAAPFASRPLG